MFGSICAQQDNLGDIAIRRLFFETFAENKTPLVLLTHRMPQTYIEAFELSGDVTLVSNPVFFQLNLFFAAISGRANLAYAPGPHTLSDAPKALAKAMLMLVNILLIKMTGGVVVTAGRAVRGDAPLAKCLEKLLIRLSKAYVVRDTVSASVVGRPLTFAPDIALGHMKAARTENRGVIACSFRSDTQVDVDTFERLVKNLDELGFKVVLVSQVARDDSQHLALAEKFELRSYLWLSKSHSEQQRIVDEIYSSSYAVVSNRLHGLIFGINCGALPVEYRFDGADKIRSTLASGFGEYIVVNNMPASDSPTEPLILAQDFSLRESEFEQAIRQAQASVHKVLSTLN